MATTIAATGDAIGQAKSKAMDNLLGLLDDTSDNATAGEILKAQAVLDDVSAVASSQKSAYDDTKQA